MLKFVPALALILASTSVYAQSQPTERDILQALYLTVAIVDFCDLPVDPVRGARAADAGQKIEHALGIDRATSEASYAQVRADFLANPPDCDAGSPDVTSVRQVLGAY